MTLPERVALLVLDTETTGLDKMRDTPFLLSGSADGKPFWTRVDKVAIRWLSNVMPKAKVTAFHNAKYDLHMLSNMGLTERVIRSSTIHCTQVGQFLVNENEPSYHLDDLGTKYFKMPKEGDELWRWLADHFGGKPDRAHQIARISKAPIEMVAKYAARDVAITARLLDMQLAEYDKQDLWQIANLERDVTKVLLFMERRGVPFDKAGVRPARAALARLMTKTEREFVEELGWMPNVRSSRDLEKMFKQLSIPYETTEAGNGSFSKEALEGVEHPLVEGILRLRTLRVLNETFLDQLEKWVYPDGRIRCDFNQTKTQDFGVRTGRLSASNPNLQQIPSPKRKEELALFIRGLFAATPGYSWSCCDWSQMDFRVFAHYTQSAKLIAALQADAKADYHQMVADLTGLQRNPFAKQLNLGLVFGMGEGLMAKKCKLPFRTEKNNGREVLYAGAEAKEIFGRYHEALPEVRPLLNRAAAVARSRGYVKTVYGQRMRFPNPKFCYKAAGYVFQGTAANLMKKKLVDLDREFSGTEIELMVPVHDEFNLLVPDGNDANKKIVEIMQDVPELNVPVYAEMGTGKNWYEASK